MYVLKKKQKENKNKQTKISYAVNLINFIIITLIYYITKQRVCETILIIKMLTISKNLVWPRDLESFKGDTSVHKISRDKYLMSLNKECQRYEKGHLEKMQNI
jgi:hypothetical protein